MADRFISKKEQSVIDAIIAEYFVQIDASDMGPSKYFRVHTNTPNGDKTITYYKLKDKIIAGTKVDGFHPDYVKYVDLTDKIFPNFKEKLNIFCNNKKTQTALNHSREFDRTFYENFLRESNPYKLKKHCIDVKKLNLSNLDLSKIEIPKPQINTKITNNGCVIFTGDHNKVTLIMNGYRLDNTLNYIDDIQSLRKKSPFKVDSDNEQLNNFNNSVCWHPNNGNYKVHLGHGSELITTLNYFDGVLYDVYNANNEICKRSLSNLFGMNPHALIDQNELKKFYPDKKTEAICTFNRILGKYASQCSCTKYNNSIRIASLYHLLSDNKQDFNTITEIIGSFESQNKFTINIKAFIELNNTLYELKCEDGQPVRDRTGGIDSQVLSHKQK